MYSQSLSKKKLTETAAAAASVSKNKCFTPLAPNNNNIVVSVCLLRLCPGPWLNCQHLLFKVFFLAICLLHLSETTTANLFMLHSLLVIGLPVEQQQLMSGMHIKLPRHRYTDAQLQIQRYSCSTCRC